VWGVGLDRRLWYCKKPCTDGKWTTQGAFSNAIQVEGDSTGTGGKYSTIPTEMWLLEPAVFRSGASVLKPNKRLQTWWIDKQFKYDLYGNMIHKQFLQAVNKIAPMVGASASVKVHSGGNNSNGSTLKIIRIGENTVRAELGGYSFISYYKHKCPSAFPYPVETGAYVNAGLCYNKKQYAQRGSGVWGSWCAWNPEDPNIKNQVSAEGKWAKCKDVVNAKLAKCPSAYPYPVEKGAYVNAKLCYNKQQYAHQGWGAANSWCAWNPEDPSIKNQLPVYGKPCKDVVNTESFTTMTTQSASDTDPSSYTSFIENAPSPSIVFDAMDNDIIISVTCYPSDDANNKKPILHKCTVKNFPLQSWVNLAISLYGRTLDIYIDGKLARTCNLPGIVKADPNADVLVTPLGGFGGYTTDIQYWDTAINPEQAYNIYRQGLDESVLGELFDKYRVKVSLLEDNKVQGSVEI
jgi:hypothetical protein